MRPLKEKVSITIDSDIIKVIKEMAEKDDWQCLLNCENNSNIRKLPNRYQ